MRSRPAETNTVSDQVAIVTGGSRGMGLATVSALAARGMWVAAVARDRGRLRSAVAGLETGVQERIVPMPADVGREAEVTSAVADVIRHFGRIDVLVNCAGTSMRARTRLVDTTTEEWERLIDGNLNGTYLMCRAVLPHFQAAGAGYVINVLSTAAFRSGPGNSLYAASKYGARALTEALIEEYRNSGIRITSVSPGPVDTSIWDLKAEPPPPGERARMLRPSDIAEIIAWLLDRPNRLHIPDITVTPWTAPSHGG